jgi:hypothetical protein
VLLRPSPIRVAKPVRRSNTALIVVAPSDTLNNTRCAATGCDDATIAATVTTVLNVTGLTALMAAELTTRPFWLFHLFVVMP